MATLSFPYFLNPHRKQQNPHFHTTHFLKPPSSNPLHPSLHRFHRFNCTPYFSSSQSSTPSSQSYLLDPSRTGRFLTPQELQKLQNLENFLYFHEFESGSLCVRVMRQEELDITVGLLSESFGESMSLPFKYVNILGYLIKQYMMERRALMPHTATLIGYYREGDEEEVLAGTVEISFDKKGANATPPTPTPPKSSPYICNMTVRKPLRRRGIGWHLLKACEDLISQMHTSREVYLHCRMIDTAPFSMYTKAGYNVIKTDNILILLTLQRRKHLMCKKLPVTNTTPKADILSISNNLGSNNTSEPYISIFDDNPDSNITSESSILNFDDNLSSNNAPESDISNLDDNLSSNITSKPEMLSFDNNSNSTSEPDISRFDNNFSSNSNSESNISNSDDKLIF